MYSSNHAFPYPCSQGDILSASLLFSETSFLTFFVYLTFPRFLLFCLLSSQRKAFLEFRVHIHGMSVSLLQCNRQSRPRRVPALLFFFVPLTLFFHCSQKCNALCISFAAFSTSFSSPPATPATPPSVSIGTFVLGKQVEHLFFEPPPLQHRLVLVKQVN